MNERLKKVVAYWLLFEFGVDCVENYDPDSGTTRQLPLQKYYVYRNDFMLDYEGSAVVKQGLRAERYYSGTKIVNTTQTFFTQLMKGMGPIWAKEIISSFKQLD